VTARVLTIGGVDPGGGAGIAADLRTLAAFGVHGMPVVTAVTVQDTLAVHSTHPIAPDIVAAQIDVVLADIGADAIKTGMLGSWANVETVADQIRGHGLETVVVDPVLASGTGQRLIDDDGLAVLIEQLLPLAFVATPNAAEATALTGVTVADENDLRLAADAVQALGPRWVVVTGGDLPGDDVVDVLVGDGTAVLLRSSRLQARDTHGTGCTFASALAACLALGDDVPTAVDRAHRYVRVAIAYGLRLGAGAGPVGQPRAEDA